MNIVSTMAVTPDSMRCILDFCDRDLVLKMRYVDSKVGKASEYARVWRVFLGERGLYTGRDTTPWCAVRAYLDRFSRILSQVFAIPSWPREPRTSLFQRMAEVKHFLECRKFELNFEARNAWGTTFVQGFQQYLKQIQTPSDFVYDLKIWEEVGAKISPTEVEEAVRVGVPDQELEEILFRALSVYPDTLCRLLSKGVEHHLWREKHVVLRAMGRRGATFRFLSAQYGQDWDVVMAAVTNDGMALQHAHNDLRADRGIIEAAIKQNPDSMAYALVWDETRPLEENRDRMLRFVRINPKVFKYANQQLLANTEFLLEAIDIDLGVFLDINEERRSDREFVLEVLRRNGAAYRHLSPEQRKDPECVTIALQTCGSIFPLVPKEYHTKSLVQLAVSHDGFLLWWVDKQFRDDEDVVETAVRQNGWALLDASPRLQKNPRLLEIAVYTNPTFYLRVPDELKYNRKILDAALGPGDPTRDWKQREAEQMLIFGKSDPRLETLDDVDMEYSWGDHDMPTIAMELQYLDQNNLDQNTTLGDLDFDPDFWGENDTVPPEMELEDFN